MVMYINPMDFFITECKFCGKKLKTISESLEMCVDCIRKGNDEVTAHIRDIHRRTRLNYNMPPEPPRAENGLLCNICVNECRIPDGKSGYCVIRKNISQKIVGGGKDNGNVDWYQDPLPTNCVGDWVCAGGNDVGYPDFSYSKGPEYGYYNLAVFYDACNFNCLFCQNWNYRRRQERMKRTTAKELADQVEPRTSCICYFGGDPGPQLPHAIEASRIALEKNKDHILRICWETNGAMNPGLLKRMMEISLESGGCVKFDLKTWTRELSLALCGVSNERTLANFEIAAEYIKRRPSPPPLIASTLLIPGYVDEHEIRHIARFIASLDPDIPYSLLAFHPDFFMEDIPRTSKRHAENAVKIAREEGLKRVRIGNVHLLGEGY